MASLSKIALLLVLFSISVYAQSSPGSEYFEKAYQTESKNPQQAIDLYERAIEKGLDTELRKAARWRLFYLQKDLKVYDSAILTLRALGRLQGIDVVWQNLRKDIQRDWSIPLDTVLAYEKSVLSGNATNLQSGDPLLRLAKEKKGNTKFRTAIAKRLVKSGMANEALSLVEGNDPESQITRADILVGAKRMDEAESLLRPLCVDSPLTDEQKSFVLYLLGRIQREKGNNYLAVSYFRYASEYAKGSFQQRYLALASFLLYKADLPIQARALLREQEVDLDSDATILDLILRVEVDGDESALRILKEQAGQLAKEKSFLAKEAIRVLEKRQ